VDDLWNIWRRGPLRAPRSLRETFELLSLYEPSEGIDALLDRVEFGDQPPAYAYEVVLNRPPEHIAAVRGSMEVHPRKRFKQALLSDEFQGKVVRLLLQAYPEKVRYMFLHIPKCAGTNLAAHLIPRFLPLSRAMESKEWTPKPKLLEWIGGIARVAPLFDTFFVYGHTFFGDYVRRVGTRMSDRIFTVVRDPLDLMVSQANYNVGLLQKDPTASRPDTRQTMRVLGIETIPDPLTPELLREFAVHALLEPRIAQPNRICAYLGDSKADMALTNLAAHNVEVTDMQRYSAWLSERWGIDSGSRQNESRIILTREEAGTYLDRLQPQIAEDEIVYNKIEQLMVSSGRVSILGAQLADG
jgi:hypothetical protein